MPKSDTWFRPGTSGNPGGRPRNHGGLAQHARQYAGETIFWLIRQLRDPRIPPGQRIRTARLLIRLGFGPGASGGRIVKELGWEAVRRDLETAAQRDEREHGTTSRRRLTDPVDQLEQYRRKIGS